MDKAAARMLAASATAVGLVMSSGAMAQQDRTHEPEGVLEHIEEAREIAGALLTWRSVLTDATTSAEEHSGVPHTPSHTLMNVDRDEVDRLIGLIAAVSRMTPSPRSRAHVPRGDLYAHVEKALEITRELQPPDATPIRTSGGRNLLTVDRTSLERLEVELDAMQDVAPRPDR